MSIGSYAIAEAALAAQRTHAKLRKPPANRLVVAVADVVQTPEPR